MLNVGCVVALVDVRNLFIESACTFNVKRSDRREDKQHNGNCECFILSKTTNQTIVEHLPRQQFLMFFSDCVHFKM